MITDIFKLRTRYGEVDKMGYVYHVNYVTYCHQARNELLRKLGLDEIQLEDKQVILVTDSRLSDNFIIYTENIKYQNIERNTKKYEEFKAKAKINFAGEIYSTYDKRINAKYNIDINNKAVDRIKNSF